MQTTESCNLCEKIVLVLESKKPLATMLELPNTFDQEQGKYVWKRAGVMAYAIVPRAVEGTMGTADYYLCLDEDDMDDLDIMEYATKYFRETIFPEWKNGKDVHLMQPSLSPPTNLACWKLRHEPAQGS
jgi:hypothetical protein